MEDIYNGVNIGINNTLTFNFIQIPLKMINFSPVLAGHPNRLKSGLWSVLWGRPAAGRSHRAVMLVYIQEQQN